LSSNRGEGPAVEVIHADDEHDEARRTAHLVVRSDPNLVRTGEIAILARTNAQLTAFADALGNAGIAVRRSATAAGSPLQAAIRHAAALGSASRLRGWAHDVLEAPDASPRGEGDPTDEPDPERRVAAAALEFLREQPLGDGATFRAWVATTNPFDDASTDGVDLLTFHAAKGREWHTVVVTGVETSLVPHKSATTAEARAEEARLLYVAFTRATDRLVVTTASRRGGYARSPSALIGDLDLSVTPAAPPPPRRRAQVDPLIGALRSWRDEAARRAGILPPQLCSDRDLKAIVEHRPTSVDELAAATSFGAITAEKLAPEILRIVADQSARSTMTGA
jgi:DNA helicase-2/ATP-dependent DNA helicase PcrA